MNVKPAAKLTNAPAFTRSTTTSPIRRAPPLFVATDPTSESPMGAFTATNAESRRIVPENPDGRPTYKIVYVVLESQYQSSMTAAVKVCDGHRHRQLHLPLLPQPTPHRAPRPPAPSPLTYSPSASTPGPRTWPSSVLATCLRR